MDNDNVNFFKGLFVVVLMFIAMSFGLAGYSYCNMQKTESSVRIYEEAGGTCYVDGVKQDDTFDIDGVDLDNYTATYKDEKLCLKSKTMSRRNKTVKPVIVPIMH